MRTAVLCFFLFVLNISLPAAHSQSAVQARFPQLTPWVSAADDLAARPTANGGMEMQILPSGAALPDMAPHAPPLGSTYVPMDNWMYPALDRLQALGYIDTAFLGIRPWTRMSILRMLQETSSKLEDHPKDETALEIFLALRRELAPEEAELRGEPNRYGQLRSVYTNLLGISGTPLRDSYHLGQTIINDEGRAYQEGFNNYTGFSALAEHGRFSLYFSGEYQHAPSAPGYSLALAETLSNIDEIPYATNPIQDTIPQGPIPATNLFRVRQAYASFHFWDHEISFGKMDHWLGPDQGASMSWSTNAENIYGFEIDRVEPFRIPLLSTVTGPFRYDFYVGSLKGHSYPNSPWVHAEKISFKPTRNLEFGFERTVIWGGKDHVPITIHSFLKSFFSVQNVSEAEKFSRDDPGARFGSFDFNYRLPFVRDWVSLYCDSIVHDDVSPISAPRRSGVHPGIYLARFPGLEALDLRVEGASTDPVSDDQQNGNFLYYETVQKQGTTNKGFLFTDWIGRDSKGGQAWLTYHLSPAEDIQLMYRRAKADFNFIPMGTTQNAFQISVVKRVKKDIELRGWLQQEEWKAPIYKPGRQSDTAISAQVTWYLKQTKSF